MNCVSPTNHFKPAFPPLCIISGYTIPCIQLCIFSCLFTISTICNNAHRMFILHEALYQVLSETYQGLFLWQALYQAPSIFHARSSPLMLLGRCSDLYLSKDEETEWGGSEKLSPNSIRQRAEFELEPSYSGWTALVWIRMLCSWLMYWKWNTRNYFSKYFPMLVALMSVTVTYGSFG